MNVLNFLGVQSNFKKQPASNINSLGTPYDFLSMMHYGKTAFGGRKTTIQTIKPRYQELLDQRGGFSSIDIQQTKKMYCGKLIVNAEQTMICLKSFWQKLLWNKVVKEQLVAFLGLSDSLKHMWKVSMKYFPNQFFPLTAVFRQGIYYPHSQLFQKYF